MTDLHQLLGTAGRSAILPISLTQVTSRGRTLRHRRRIRRASIVATSAAAAAGGVLALLSGTHAETTDPPRTTVATAAWSKSLIGLPLRVSADYASLCRAESEIGARATPRGAADIFNSNPVASTQLNGPEGLAVLVFRSGSAFADCVLNPSRDTGPMVIATQLIPDFVDAGADVTPTGTYGSADLSFAFGTTSSDVAAVHIVVNGSPIVATLDHGVFAAIVPPSTSHQTLLRSTVEAFDSTGARLDQVPLIPPTDQSDARGPHSHHGRHG